MTTSPPVVADVRPTTPASPTNNQTRTHLLLLLVLWLCTYGYSIFQPPLMDDADTIHAEAAREMVLRGDWVTLYADGIRYLEKAPLMYWMTAASYTVFGVHDWSTRLPMALSGLALMLLVYRLGRRIYGADGGFYAALAAGLAIGPYIYTRFLIPDLLVGVWLVVTFGLFLHSLRGEVPSRWACWGMAAASAANVLSKGLIGLVFPVAVIGFYLLLTGQLKRLLKMHVFSSLLVFLALGAPWHILAAIQNPPVGQSKGFLWFYFVNEHFLRYIGERYPKDYDKVPLLVFWLLTIVWMFPWAVFLPQALREAPWRLRTWRNGLSERQRANLIFALWALLIVAFFTFSTRQEYYTLPALPALALLLGGWLQREADSEPDSAERRSGRVSSWILLGIGVLAFAAGMLLLAESKTSAVGADLADLLKKNPEDYQLSFGHIFDLTPRALGVFRLPLAGVAISMLLGTVLNWWYRRKNESAKANFTLATMAAILLLCVHAAFTTFSPILSSQKLAVAIEQQYQSGDVIVIDGEYKVGSSVNFYTKQQVHILNARTGNLWYGSLFPDAPAIFEDDNSLAALWSGPHRVYLWTDKPAPPQLASVAIYTLAQSGGKFIFTNQPLR